MAQLNKYHRLVFSILETHKETRGDDFLLFNQVLKELNLNNCDIDYILRNHAILGIPSFETITRCRRKIQHNNPELRGEAMRVIRKEEERQYREYARSETI